ATQDSIGHLSHDYRQFLDAGGLRGARIGIARQFFGIDEHIDRVAEPAIQGLKDLGAVIVDPAIIPTLAQINNSPTRTDLLLYEFKADVNAYLGTRPDLAVHSLADLITFNRAHAAEEMPYFLQQLFEQSQAKGPLTDAQYKNDLATNRRLSRTEGLDKLFADQSLDPLFAPTRNPAWTIDVISGDRSIGGSSTPAALACHPLLSLPPAHPFRDLPAA